MTPFEDKFIDTQRAEGLVRTEGPERSVDAIRVLDFMETSRVSGPAKNLIEFVQQARNWPLQLNMAVATFRRGNSPGSNEFIKACQQAGIDVELIHERFLFDPAIIVAMRKHIAAYKPDIVQTHSVKSHFLMRLSGMHRHCCWIAFHHGYTWTSARNRLYNRFDR